jgi:hypothetical protein
VNGVAAWMRPPITFLGMSDHLVFATF